jgi:IclR family pca regulon transcriptional regulator
MGQVLLAHLPADALESYLKRARLVERTNRTITTVPKLRKALAEVRGAGYTVLDQELEVGLRSISVPVRDGRGTVVAAINVGTHASRASLDDMRRRFLPPLLNCAQGLGIVLPA